MNDLRGVRGHNLSQMLSPIPNLIHCIRSSSCIASELLGPSRDLLQYRLQWHTHPLSEWTQLPPGSTCLTFVSLILCDKGAIWMQLAALCNCIRETQKTVGIHVQWDGRNPVHKISPLSPSVCLSRYRINMIFWGSN